MEDRTFKAELQGGKVWRRRRDERSERGNGEVQVEGGEGGIMKSSGSLVEEAMVPASQHSLTLYRWRHAGICSVQFQIRKWMFFKFENILQYEKYSHTE